MAYRNAEALSTMHQEVALLRRTLEASNQGVIVLTQEARVRLMTSQARQWVAAYFGHTPREGEPLPDSAQGWARHQEAQPVGADHAPPPRKPFVVEREGTRLVVRHLCEANGCILLMEERHPAVRPASFEPLGLTRRETEVLQWVAEGKTNAEIAIILVMSPRTVQKHLEHIFEKLGVETRTAAATWALVRIPSQEP